MTSLNGLFVPMITPFAEDGSVAVSVLERLALDVLDAGATGLVALGTTGEPSALTADERRVVLELLAGVCGRRGAALIVGANDPRSLAALDPEVVTAALTLVPPFLRPGEDGTVAYLAACAAASPVPLILYHVPYRTAQPLSAAALRRIAAIPGVAGVKLAAGGIDAEVIDLMAAVPPGFAVLGGDDVVISPLLALGAQGGILASALVEPAEFAALISEWQAGDACRARERGHRLARLSAALFAEPNPTVIKGVLHARGRIPTPVVRLPLLPASPAAVAACPPGVGFTDDQTPRPGPRR